jgi:hypothetical protein
MSRIEQDLVTYRDLKRMLGAVVAAATHNLPESERSVFEQDLRSMAAACRHEGDVNGTSLLSGLADMVRSTPASPPAA